MDHLEDNFFGKERQRGTHLIVISAASALGLLVTFEGVMRQWELWFLVFLLLALVLMWVSHIRQSRSTKTREVFYANFLMLSVLFHGIHESSFTKVSFLVIILLVILAQMDYPRWLDYAFIEYQVLNMCQGYYRGRAGNIGKAATSLPLIDIFIYFFIVTAVYILTRNAVVKRNQNQKKNISLIEEQKKTSQNMEDFLANISHEFRTPINVVMGMSSLVMKDTEDGRITAIHQAGRRLSGQVESILDYTEITSDRLVLSEETYMISSLINDIVQRVQMEGGKGYPELIVDIDPDIPKEMTGDVPKLRKILLHLLSNAFKFTEKGGVYLQISAASRDYGVNLDIQVTDTGIGMTRDEAMKASNGLYQGHKGRERSTGGIGLGLSIVYGFVHAMEGFVKIESEPGRGTTVWLSIPQRVANRASCFSVDQSEERYVICYMKPEKYQVPRVRDFYQNMIENLSRKLKTPVNAVVNLRELKNVLERKQVTHIFMGWEEYEEERAYFDEISKKICVAVATEPDFTDKAKSHILHLPKPLYGLPIVNILNEGECYRDTGSEDMKKRPVFSGVRVLVVDDEEMNLVVATGLFRDYGMSTETAESGMEALLMCRQEDYDVVFMDHMMPQMDGVEAMKRIREAGRGREKIPIIVALTANAVSGAREMFLSEGFDGFIAKPIEIGEFERVMKNLLPEARIRYVDRRQ